MNRNWVVAGVTSFVVVASYVCFTAETRAGCGCGAGNCPCGQGPKTSEVTWDDSIAVPVEATGKDADKAARGTWSADDLKSGKPLLVYYFVDGLTEAKDDSYKLSQNFEMNGLPAEGVLKAVKNDWRAKKVSLDAKADRKDPKNQARLEFWAFTGAKLGQIAAKEAEETNAKPLQAKLTSFAAKNRAACNAEIKKLAEAAKATSKK